MKPLLLFILLLFFCQCFSQNWSPAGAQWTYGHYTMVSNGIVKYTYKKDTTVLQQPCKKIARASVEYDFFLQHRDTGLMSPVFTYASNDTVYMLNNDIFWPVYFWNAATGDTLRVWNGLRDCGADTLVTQLVDSAGTMLINGETLRFYRAHSIYYSSSFLYPEDVFVVEKLGALNNFYQPFFTCYTDDDSYGLRCYKDDNFSLYQTGNTECDYIFTGIEEIQKPVVTIYPNPVAVNLHLQVEHPEKIAQLSIYNSTGGLQAAPFEITGGSINMPVNTLAGGLYLLYCRFVDGSTSVSWFIKE